VVWCLKERVSAAELCISCSRGDQSVDIAFPSGVWTQKEPLVMTETKLMDACLPPVSETLKTGDKGQAAQDSKGTVPLAMPNGTHSPLDFNPLIASSELLNWFGLVCCRLPGPLQDPTASLNPFVNSFAMNSLEDSSRGTVFCMRSRGIFLPGQILGTLTAIRRLVESGSVPWCAVAVWGFSDAPISWSRRNASVFDEHSFVLEGDNIYLILVLPDSRYAVFQIIDGADTAQ